MPTPPFHRVFRVLARYRWTVKPQAGWRFHAAKCRQLTLPLALLIPADPEHQDCTNAGTRHGGQPELERSPTSPGPGGSLSAEKGHNRREAFFRARVNDAGVNHRLQCAGEPRTQFQSGRRLIPSYHKEHLFACVSSRPHSPTRLFIQSSEGVEVLELWQKQRSSATSRPRSRRLKLFPPPGWRGGGNCALL